MNDTEVTKTIQQMVRFIKQEAEEKASEIMISAEEEFNITKLQLLEAEKQKVRRDFERREAAIEVKKKVEKSKQLNESRLRVLQAREDAMQHLLREAQVRLGQLSKDQAAYSRLLQDLLLQAVNKLGDSKALVRCRAVDVPLVQQILPGLEDAYRKKYNVSEAPSVELDGSKPLPPPPQTNEQYGDEYDTCTGGVVVTSVDGKIVCSNTLDDRLKISYAASLPKVRAMLFQES